MSRIRFYEWLAGKLLVMSARLRARRADGLSDAHEIRHIGAALYAGNSDSCADGRRCFLDDALVERLRDDTFRGAA